MRFTLDCAYLHSPRPLGLHALKLRLALISLYEEFRQGERGPVGDHRPIGCRVPSIDVRRLIGLGDAHDARALRSAVDELIGDPAIRWAIMTDDGRHVEFVLVDELCEYGYLERYVLLDRDEIGTPKTVADFHLWMRYAEARRMRAPFASVEDDHAMAMSGPDALPDRAWARRTLLPAAQRLAARIEGSVFVGAVWPVDPTMPPALRLRFGARTSHWRSKPFRKVWPNETAWLVTATGRTCLRRARIVPILAP